MKVLRKSMKTTRSSSHAWQGLASLMTKMKIHETDEDHWETFATAIKEANILSIISSYDALKKQKITTLPVWVITHIGKHCSASTFEFLYAMGMVNMHILHNTNVLMCLVEGISLTDNHELLAVIVKQLTNVEGRLMLTDDQMYLMLSRLMMALIDNQAYNSLQVVLSCLHTLNHDNRYRALVSECLQHAMTQYNTRLITILLEFLKPMKNAPMCIEC